MSKLKSTSKSSQETRQDETQIQRRADRCYLVSSKFDYEEIICSDKGPDYAKHMGWEVEELDDVEAVLRQYPVVIFDTEFDQKECEILRSVVQENRNTLFGFSAIDPQPYTRDLPYPETLYDVKDEPNVFFLSRYQPKGIFSDLVEAVGRDKLVTIPYAFVEPTLPMDDFEERTWKLLHSGKLHKGGYPSRQAVFRIRKWIFPFRSYIDVLSHPGYPDTGDNLEHNIIGDKYINFISKYAFMFLSPSRHRIELLKFRECAMAGCVPVGVTPDGFHDDMRGPFVEKKCGSFIEAALSIPSVFGMSMEEAKDRAESYREAYRKHRNPQVLNRKLDSFLDQTGRL